MTSRRTAIAPSMENNGGRSMILCAHFYHEQALRNVRPSIDTSPPKSLRTSIKARSRDAPPTAAVPLGARPNTAMSRRAQTPTTVRSGRQGPPQSPATPSFSSSRRSADTHSAGRAMTPASASAVSAARRFAAAGPTLRSSKYDLDEEAIMVYEDFVRLLARFDKTTMVDLAEDVLKDAQDQKLLANYTGTSALESPSDAQQLRALGSTTPPPH